MKKITSALYSLDKSDWMHGLKMAIGGAITAPVLNTLTVLNTTGHFSFDAKQVGIGALVAGGLYLVKKYFTDSQVVTPLDGLPHNCPQGQIWSETLQKCVDNIG